MGKKRYIDTDFWTDSWVVDNLDPLDCHLFMYLLTNPQTTIAGVYKLSLRIMSFQIGIEKDKLVNMLRRLEPKVFYIDGWVILKNGIKNQNYRNDKIGTGILLALEDVPEHILQHISWPKDFGQKRPKLSNQTTLLDKSYMSLDESLHSNTNSNTNLNSNTAASQPLAFKKNYAKAAQADRDLEARVEKRKHETSGTKKVVKSAADIAREKLRAKGLNV